MTTSIVAVATAVLLAMPNEARAQNQSAPEKLNILFLLADDWRWDTLGCAGNPVVKTPHLDALAARGVRFTQARVTTSICSVSRASILTGQHMARHGIRAFGVALAPKAWEETYVALLRRAGYWTGFVGKFGVGKAAPAHFDFLRAYEGVHWLKDGQAGKIHVTQKNEQDAVEFLRQRPKDQPFCLSVSFFAAHAEDKAPEQYLPQPWSEKLYDGVKIPVPKTATQVHFQRLPPFLATDKNEGRVRWRKRFDTPEKYQLYMKNYYRLVSEADAAVGKIIEELKRQGVYENTLIVFSTDNGYFHGERGLADKWYPYEEALRVPLLVCDPRLPKEKRGQSTDAMALNIDLAPLFLGAAGIEPPQRMQGRDLAPLYLSAKPPPWRDEFYYQHPVILGKDRIPQSEAVVRREHVYIYWPDFQFEELFDHARDPLQETNVAGDPALAHTLQIMRKKLETWRESAK
ncbi:MAG: sulfatase [Gemmataceae bacterium]|nr:sulfatase [Gemmataceae bacterium]